MVLLEATADIYIIYYCLAVLAGFAIFYYLIKYAVKYGTIEAHNELNSIKTQPPPVKESVNISRNQKALQDRYDKGEITFEEYKAKWDTVN